MKLLETLGKVLSFLTIPLGRWFRVPVYLHWSWTVLFLVILCLSPKLALIWASVFFIVLLHEFGHCLAGHYYKVPVRDIVLYPFGGAAAMYIPPKPGAELVIALAGPAVNVLLIPVLFGLSYVHSFFYLISIYNIILLVFNLLPVFPMDGGRVLRACLSYFLNNHVRATVIAGRVGQGFCLLFAVVGMFTGQFMLPVIGLLIAMAAEQEIEAVRNGSHLLVPGSEDDPPPAVSESASILSDLDRRLSEHDRRHGG